MAAVFKLLHVLICPPILPIFQHLVKVMHTECIDKWNIQEAQHLHIPHGGTYDIPQTAHLMEALW